MGPVVYFLGTLTTLLCSILLLRAYVHVRQRLLLWSGLCFLGLTISNVILFVDLVILTTEVTLYTWRLATAAGAMSLLVYGLILESD